MSKVDFLEDSHEISSSYSDSSEVGDVNTGCDFQNLQPYQLEPEKQNQANSFQCGHSPDKVGGEKPTQVSTKSCWKHWVVSVWEMSCRDQRN